MGFFGKKNQQAEQDRMRQQLNLVADRCRAQVSSFTGMEINGRNYHASDLETDVSRMVFASALVSDESILWWTGKVCALILDAGESLPIRELAKNLLWCKLTASEIVNRHPKQIPTLQILNNIDQAWFFTMENGPHYKEALELIAQDKDKLLEELQES